MLFNMNDICKLKELIFSFDTLTVQKFLFSRYFYVWFLNVIIGLIVRLEIKNMVMTVILGGKMEKLTGGWRKLH